MCIWNVAEEDRKCQYCSFHGGCERLPRYLEEQEIIRRSEKYIEVMNGLIGEDIRGGSRRWKAVLGRNFVAYQLKKDGASSVLTGKLLQKDHSTMLMAVKKCEYILEHPGIYSEEIELWKTFLKTIDYEQIS